MGERESTVSKGNRLENEVANLYRQFDGVLEVKQKVLIQGVEVDVFVVISTGDGIVSRYAIDAKNYEGPVKAERARECVNNFQLLRNSNEIDHGIIVATEGFTKGAHAAAQKAGVHTIDVQELRRRSSGFSTYLRNWIKAYQSGDYWPEVYIPLRARNDQGESVGRLESHIFEWLRGPEPLITLLGNYGTGKSTTLRQVMLQQAERYLADPACERIPIFVDLKKYRQAPATDALITHLLVNQSGVSMNYAKFTDLNASGRFLIIFDGFDEMAERVLDGMPRDHFRELAQLAIGKAKVIISSRTHYFRDHQEVLSIHSKGETELFEEAKSQEGFRVLFLESFSKHEIETYLKKRFSDSWTEYKTVIDSTYDLGSLAEVPILLNMIVQALPAIRKQGGKVNRSAIYRHFTDRWLDREQWRRTLRPEERKFFCRSLAHHFYKTQQNSVHWRDLPWFLKEYLKTRQIETYDDLDVFSSDVRTSNFLNRDDGGYYSFVHKSFMEYFVAEHFLEAIRQEAPNGLDALRDPSKSRVVWEFLLEMLQQDDVDRLRKDAFLIEKVDLAGLAGNRQLTSRKVYTNPQSLGNMAGLLLAKGISLKKANLEEARLEGMTIANISLEGALLNGASFRGSRLSRVNMGSAYLSHASFDQATLHEVDFSHANVDRVDLLSCQLDWATVDSIARAKHWGSVHIKPAHKARIQRLYEQAKTIQHHDTM